MTKFRQYLEEKKQCWIEVDVKDAKKAMDILKDDPNMKYNAKASNYYTFPNTEEMVVALEAFKKAGISILNSSKNLNEAKRLNSDSFSIYVQNAVIRAIDEWERKNLDPVEGWGWEHSKQRSEFYLKLVKDLKDFLRGMERTAKQDLKK